MNIFFLKLRHLLFHILYPCHNEDVTLPTTHIDCLLYRNFSIHLHFFQDECLTNTALPPHYDSCLYWRKEVALMAAQLYYRDEKQCWLSASKTNSSQWGGKVTGLKLGSIGRLGIAIEISQNNVIHV